MKVIEVVSKGETFEVMLDDDFWHTGKIYKAGKYFCITVDGKLKGLHRHIMKAPEGLMVDHIDGNRANNQRSNLRLATNQQNQGNRKAKGYHFMKNRNKWCAQIRVDGKLKTLGLYTTEEEAAKVYREAHKEYFKEFSVWQ